MSHDESWMEQERLIMFGLLDPDQPTEYATVTHRRKMRKRLTAPFTAKERMTIRLTVGKENKR